MIAVGAPSGFVLYDFPGTVYVYRRIANVWTLEQELDNPNPTPRARFGSAVCFVDDRLVVGAAGWTNGPDAGGNVFAYQFNGASWELEATIRAAGLELNDNFGSALAFEADRLVVGASGDDDIARSAGALYIFEHESPATWTETAKLVVPTGREDDFFGRSISLHGNILLAGDDSSDAIAQSTGSAHVFEYDGANWNYTSRIWPPSLGRLNQFGNSVGISDEQLLIGAPGSDDFGNNEGAVYVHEMTTVADTDCNGNGIADECELVIDCNSNGVQDICEIESGIPGFGDCDGDFLLDVCEINDGEDDCNKNLIPDRCELDRASPRIATTIASLTNAI